jgi:hypothetical protein
VKSSELSAKLSSISSIEEIYAVVIDGVIDYLCNIVLPFCEDVEYLFIAVDGVPSKAKMIEQRRRRYAGDTQEIIREQIYKKYNKIPPQQLWNRSMISPGTDFMNFLDVKLFSSEVRTKIYRIYPKLKRYIYSGSNVREEGEHKILSFLRSLAVKEEEKIVVFSPDSDTPVLCLTLDSAPAITIIRHNQQEGTYDIIDINRFYQEISSRVGSSNKGVKDLALLFTVFGNDFVPKIPSYDVRFNFEHLFIIYLQVFYKLRDRLIVRGKNFALGQSDKDQPGLLEINLNFLGEIFSIMAETEQLKLKINYLAHYDIHLPSAIYMMLEEGKLDPRDPLNSFFHLFFVHRYDRDYDKYFSKFRDFQEFRLFTGMTNKDEYRRISDPIEKEVFSATHRVNPKDFLRLGEVDLINSGGSYMVQSKGYSPAIYYNEFFGNEDIRQISKNYVRGLIWVFNRYFLNKESDWVYPYTRAPLMTDIARILISPGKIDFKIPNIKLWFTPIQHLFYITPIPRLLRLIPKPYVDEIPRKVIQLFDEEVRKHIQANDLLDSRGVTYMNKSFPRIEFPLLDEQVKSMFKNYPKHSFNFDSRDINILRNQNYNLAIFSGIIGSYLKNNFPDEIVMLQTRCLKEKVLPILDSM